MRIREGEARRPKQYRGIRNRKRIREIEEFRKYHVIETKETRSLWKKQISKSQIVQLRRIVFYKTEDYTGDIQERSLNIVMRVKIRLQRLK